MAVESLVLVANPGSASRKYALFQGSKRLLKLHFEFEGPQVVCTIDGGAHAHKIQAPISHIAFAASVLGSLLSTYLPDFDERRMSSMALRVVAPATFFQRDRQLNPTALSKLTKLQHIAPLHINATIAEYHMLRKFFTKQPIIGISDSSFLKNKPPKAAMYAIPLKHSKKFDIKRFGYHGLSLESAAQVITSGLPRLHRRVVVCHLGSGASVAAIVDGVCIDSTMGFSPNEGIMMATRSGDIDISAARHIEQKLKLNREKLEQYLQTEAGLRGVSGSSSDIRELVSKERKGDANARLALEMYVYRVQKAIGSMIAAMSGVDALVFTGTVGERSMVMRRRIVHGLLYVGLRIDTKRNHQAGLHPGQDYVCISPGGAPAPIYIIGCDEERQMAVRAQAFRKK